jgi:hypothetical protein
MNEGDLKNSLIYLLVFYAIHCIHLAIAHLLIIYQLYLTVMTINTALLINDAIQLYLVV